MSYLPKSVVLSKVKKIRRRSATASGGYVDGYEAYFGVDSITHRPKRVFRTDIDELKREIRDFFQRLSFGGDMAVCLTAEQAMDAQRAYKMLRGAGVETSLADAIGAFLNGRGNEVAQSSETIDAALGKYMDAMSDKSKPYQKDIRLRVGEWARAFGGERPLSQVSAPEVKKYLTDRFYRQGDVGSWVTYNNNLGNIKSFLGWCAALDQKMIPSNPLAGMKKITIPYRQPKYMKAAEVERMFSLLWRERENIAPRLAHAVLSFFCGMRQSEIDRVPLGDEYVTISIEEQFVSVRVPKGSSKGIFPRTFTIPDQALAWMRAFDFMDAAKKPAPHQREWLVAFCKKNEIDLPKNAGRHTFITMFEAAHHDASALTAIVGNTEGVRNRAYNGVELKREGEAYFRILPPSS